MGSCEPGHHWRPEREGTNYVRYQCADCGSVCVAPKPVDEPFLEVRRTSSPRPTADADGADRKARRPMEGPFGASMWGSTSSPAG